MKNIFQKLIRLCEDNDYRFRVLDSFGFFNGMDDEKYISKKYHSIMGKKLNLDHPTTFNEKLQWLKINDRNPLYSSLVDKYEVKQLVQSKISDCGIIKTIGVWNSFDQINFDLLPERFVLKCTHDRGSYFVCRNKAMINKMQLKKKYKTALNKNFYYYGREWPYKDVKPRIIAEEYIENVDRGDLYDYKFFCFNGQVNCYKIDFNRQSKHQANYFDRDSNLLRFGEVICPPDYDHTFSVGEEIPKMISYAEKLSNGIPFVRVDFYYCENKIYFGELTFFPASGWGKFEPSSADLILGNWLELPDLQ